MSLREYLEGRIDVLVTEGTLDRDALIGQMVDSAEIDVAAFLGGSVACRDLDAAEAMGAALGLDVDDVAQVALGGTLMESRLVCFESIDDAMQSTGRQSKAIFPQELASNENEFVSSTEVEARDGDIIDQASWRLGHYRKNPVVLEGHRMDRVVGHTTKIERQPQRLVSRIRWDDSEFNPEGRLVAHQHQKGIRRAVSVRWITGKHINRNELPADDPRYQKKPKRIKTMFGAFDRFGLVHMDNVLLEQSSVSVPGDPRALQQRGIGADAAGIVASAADSVAAAEMRSQMIDALKSEALWADDAFRSNFGDLVRRLVRDDVDLRRLLRAVNLTGSVDPLSPDQKLIASL